MNNKRQTRILAFVQTVKHRIDDYINNSPYGIKTKLIAIFVVIKVFPVIVLSWLAWNQIVRLAVGVEHQSTDIIATTRSQVADIGLVAVQDSTQALDMRAREEIEQLTVTTARNVADFLYDRDADIRLAAALPISEDSFRRFLSTHHRTMFEHEPWVLAADGRSWEPASPAPAPPVLIMTRVRDNERDWHYSPPIPRGKSVSRPLYLEMTYVDLSGRELVKATASDLLSSDLRDISRRENTYTKAETYWPELQKLQPGEIYVSDVIGPYVGSPIIGPYTPSQAKARGVPYAPEQAAYAGKENPVGKRFQGLVRWAMPVTNQGRITGYITLALDHRHLMEFTDHIVPTEERYSPIKDASSGNYAFIWDYQGRSICHPREHSIVGYDPQTGDPAVPWLEEAVYEAWQKSGMDLQRFLAGTPSFQSPSQTKRPAAALTRAGQVGLDCRYLNFAPQCAGWHELTEQGGSGSFLILWSGLWKRTTAAAIPYYTGKYGQHPRGFGYVTIGTNVAEFRRPAEMTANRINQMVDSFANEITRWQNATLATIRDSVADTVVNLTLMTLLMIVAVIAIAIWMAGFITQHLTRIISGIRGFERGDLNARLAVESRDELGALAVAFNNMADKLQQNIAELENARAVTEDANRNLEQRVKERTEELERVLAEVEAKATSDSLTGLFNRRKFDEMLRLEFNRFTRYGRSASLILLDIDHFKQVNDVFGHQAGDSVLVEIAKALAAQARNVDTLCRWGGEEFAVLLPETDLAQALLAAEHFRQAVAAHSFPIAMQISISLGVAQFKPGETIDNALRRTDLALYAAKKAGRNTVCPAE